MAHHGHANYRTELRITTILFLLATCLLAPIRINAESANDGYFYGVELQPINSASIQTVETEPALALIFALDEKTADVTMQFDQWYSGPTKPDINVYAIAVQATGMSDEAAQEAISLRNLQMPVFLSHADMLLGDDYRVLILNDDQEVARFTTLDLPGVNTEIEKLGIQIPVPAAPTVQSTPSSPSGENTGSIIMGGKSGEQIYDNMQYGMTVEFPPGWQYQIASQRDGAVAIAPRGSKMDMRMWAQPQGDTSTPQKYVDKYLENYASKHKTRINIERRFFVKDNGLQGLDVTYNYLKPLDSANPYRGGMIYKGRIQVFIQDSYIKAAGVQSPSGEFMARFPTVESFFHSFKINPADLSVQPDSPNFI